MKLKLGKYFIEIAKEKRRARHLTPKQVTQTITDLIPLVAVASITAHMKRKLEEKEVA